MGPYQSFPSNSDPPLLCEDSCSIVTPMSKTYRRVAVIGAGPSGLAAVRALSDENLFDTIRVFERRDRVGGIW